MYLEKEDISVHSIIDTFTFLHPSKIQEQEWEIFFFHEIRWSTKKSITGDFNGRWHHYYCQDFFTCINLFELSESLSDEQFGYGIIMQQIYFTHVKGEWKRTCRAHLEGSHKEMYDNPCGRLYWVYSAIP